MSDQGFKQIQNNFTDHIRCADFQSVEGIEDRRLKVYRDLFYNNVESFISGTFPVLKECVNEQTWGNMVRRFFIEHTAHSPYFLQISEEFLEFLSQDEGNTLLLPDYAYSLAHWEWMELFADAYVATNAHDISAINLDHDILTTTECAWLQAYEYPVHTIEPSEKDSVIQTPTFLLIYRDISEQVGFIALNPLSYLLFECLQKNTQHTVQEVVHTIATAHDMPLQQLLSGAYETLAHWADLQLIKKIKGNTL